MNLKIKKMLLLELGILFLVLILFIIVKTTVRKKILIQVFLKERTLFLYTWKVFKIFLLI